MASNERGSGRTTAQLKAAPRGVVFIVESFPQIAYTKRLIDFIGRSQDDFRVMSLTKICSGGGHRLRAYRPGEIILDHYARESMNAEQARILRDFL